MRTNIIEVDIDNFDEQVIKSALPVLVDFYSLHCQPCLIMLPILGEIADIYASKLKITTCDIDNNFNLASNYDIRAVPTLMLFKNGRIAWTHVGALAASKLNYFLHSLL